LAREREDPDLNDAGEDALEALLPPPPAPCPIIIVIRGVGVPAGG